MTLPHSLYRARRAVAGMTLVEAMLCLLIVALLASLAAPAFRDMLLRQRIAAVRTELSTALQWARWEAVRRNSAVTLQRRSDCPELLQTQNDWHCGWNIVASVSGQPQVLQTFALPPRVHLAHTNGGETLQFARHGMPTLVAHKFVIGASAAVTPLTTALCINRTGRVRTVVGQATC